MYYIEAQKDSYKWISAIFMDKEKALSYMEKIPAHLKECQALCEIPLNTYPVYLVEGDVFHFCDVDGVHAALQAIEIKPDYEHIYLNIYKISEDFQSPKPGADYMGALFHIHVHNDFMHHYQAAGKGCDPFSL